MTIWKGGKKKENKKTDRDDRRVSGECGGGRLGGLDIRDPEVLDIGAAEGDVLIHLGAWGDFVHSAPPSLSSMRVNWMIPAKREKGVGWGGSG